jgi:hypothetical protein
MKLEHDHRLTFLSALASRPTATESSRQSRRQVLCDSDANLANIRMHQFKFIQRAELSQSANLGGNSCSSATESPVHNPFECKRMRFDRSLSHMTYNAPKLVRRPICVGSCQGTPLVATKIFSSDKFVNDPIADDSVPCATQYEDPRLLWYESFLKSQRQNDAQKLQKNHTASSRSHLCS